MTLEERALKLAKTLDLASAEQKLVLAALRAQREEALEEAAKECESLEENEMYDGYALDRNNARTVCASEIRALKTQTGGGDERA